MIDFELFRPELDRALARSDRARGGRPPHDAVLMVKLLVLQTLYTLADEQAEYQLKDRLSFRRFVGLGLGWRVPDATTLGLCREHLTRAGAIERLFARFDVMLRGAGCLAMGGQIVDATVVPARRPGLIQDEKATVRGGVPAGWSEAKRAPMDRDGRWTVKRGRRRRRAGDEPQARVAIATAVPVFGDKNHLGIDRRHGFIRRYTVTHAAAPDGRPLDRLLNPATTAASVRADTAYRSRANVALLGRRGLAPHFQRPKPRGKPMPPPIKRSHATSRARVRAAVEHAFAAQTCRLGLLIRSIGLARATAKLGLANLVTNMRRLAWFETNPASA